MSHAQFGRIERGELAGVSVDQLSRACQAVGLRLIARAVPDADPALDAGQLAVLARLEAILPRAVPVRREVPMPIAGDRRAWDAVLGLDPADAAVEAEARLRDIQALDRRCALKLRDGVVSRLILLVSDTAHNRAVLAQHREALRSTFPLDTREVLLAIRAGRTPAANGIVVL